LFSSSFSRKKASEKPEKALSTGFEPRQRLRTLFKMRRTKGKGSQDFARGMGYFCRFYSLAGGISAAGV